MSPVRLIFYLARQMVLWLSLSSPVWAGGAFLPPEQAFRAQALLQDSKTVQVIIDIAPGYYLYRKRLRWETQPPSIELGPVSLPPGQIKHDPNFNEDLEVYHDQLVFNLPVRRAASDFALSLSYQGCAEKGLCYPPVHAQIQVQVVGGKLIDARLGDAANASNAPDATSALDALRASTRRSALGDQAPSANPRPSADGSSGAVGLDLALRTGRWWQVIAVFFAAGVLLSLTPCVLPLVPILSTIIIGTQPAQTAGAEGHWRNFALAASYSLGLALVYTAVGIAAGFLGQSLTAALQTPWVLGAFALVLVLLSLSMFGWYDLQLPHGLQSKLSAASGRLRGGQVLGVFVMGMLSALIVGPCVSAPLAAALIYIGTTHDARLGGTALFSLASGMSVPLMLVGLSADSWIPRAGAWMNQIKVFFGFVLLGVAWWMVSPLLPTWWFMSGLGLLLVTMAVFCFRLFDPLKPSGRGRGWQLSAKVAGLLVALVGLAQWVGVMSGSEDPLRPLGSWHAGATPAGGSGQATQEEASTVRFRRVSSVEEFEAIARGAQGVVVLDFYADWCVSCKEMERFTFNHAPIARRMRRAVLLQFDVTANTPENTAMLKHFGVFGPPATLFFRSDGQTVDEVLAARTIGFLNSDGFAQRLNAAGL